MCWSLLFYRQSWLKLLEGKQNNLNNLGKLLFAAFEGQWLYAVLVQEWGGVSGLLCSSFVAGFSVLFWHLTAGIGAAKTGFWSVVFG